MEHKQTPDSSQISSIGYDKETKIFEVVYKSNGATYQYKDVPIEKWEAAKTAESIGKYVGANIKQHQFTKVA